MRQKDMVDTIELLKGEIEIPEVVQKRAESAFARIKEETQQSADTAGVQQNAGMAGMQQNADMAGKALHGEKLSGKELHKKKSYRKASGGLAGRRAWSAAAVAAAVLVVFGVGAAAAYMQWSKGLEEGLQTTASQRQALEDSQMASFVGQSVTQGDVTVTMQQSIVDNYFAYLSFKVEGFEVEDGVQPGFSGISVEVEDTGNYTGGWGASFYDGLIPGENGRAIHADSGIPVTEGEQTSYTMADGNLEFQVTMQTDKKGVFIDKPIHVVLKDLGTYSGKAEDVEVAAEGTWKFDWTLQGSDEVVKYEPNTALGDSGATLLTAELSPISVSLTYDFPRREETEEAIDENGNPFMHTTYAETPYFYGVRLKDGTMYTGLAGGGVNGYKEDNSDIYEVIRSLDRVIDVEQVESLLFIKSYPEGEGEQPLTEENLYIVPVE
ncbi:MAG: DUF4179 domain-containing protein [Lachnospiraceae bacterium]|nr:DUF4179 domain-containing protein [Lachnospiraceae bacterium]